MFIAHLPAGYIAAKNIIKKQSSTLNSKYLLIFALIGSIAPDFDLIYFYFIDNRQHHHHTYWSHYPIVWITLLLSTILYSKLKVTKLKIDTYIPYIKIFLFCGLIHLMLDSVVGDIWWLAPFVDKAYALATVPRVFQLWWLNFLIHWSFILELFILLYALKIYKNKKS